LTTNAAAPWYVIPAEYKWYARIAVAKTVVKILARGITCGRRFFFLPAHGKPHHRCLIGNQFDDRRSLYKAAADIKRSRSSMQ
jgi:hypothetical protein